MNHYTRSLESLPQKFFGFIRCKTYFHCHNDNGPIFSLYELVFAFLVGEIGVYTTPPPHIP